MNCKTILNVGILAHFGFGAKLAAAVAVVMVLAWNVLADDAEGIRTAINTATGGYDLIVSVSDNTVTVTGTLSGPPSDADFLTLEIGAGVTVKWQAALRGGLNTNYSLINISGGSGTFQVLSGGVIENNGTGRAITNHSEGTVTVAGGTVATKGTHAIYNDYTGTVNVTGGKVENTLTASNSYAIYNYPASSGDAAGTVNVSGGGTVVRGGEYAIYNYVRSGGGGTVTVSGAEVGAIYNYGGSVTVSSGTVYRIYNTNSGTVDVSGGTIGEPAMNNIAIYNNGTVNISGSETRITSAHSASSAAPSLSGTIQQQGGTLNITGGTIDNMAMFYGNTINNRSNSSIINISGGTVVSESEFAIYNYAFTGTLNISGGTIKTNRNDGFIVTAAIYAYGKNGTVKITGGTIQSHEQDYAIFTTTESNNAPPIVLGGSPVITGRIYTHSEKLSVITTAPDIFNPDQNTTYMLDFPEAQYVSGGIAVVNGRNVNGRNCIDNFTLYNPNYVLSGSLQNLAIVTAVIVNFDPNDGSAILTYSVVPGSTLSSLPTPSARPGHTFSGWFTDPTGGTEVTTGTVFDVNTTVYARWTPTSTPATYTLTVSAGEGGTLSGTSTASGSYEEDYPVSVTATADGGYHFVNWTAVGVTLTGNTTNPATFSMPANAVTLTANFALDPTPTYTISASTLTSFGSLQVGYTQPAAQTVTITNTGTEAVTLTQPTSADYDIGQLSTTTIAAGAPATFTVQPKASLGVGTHNETITVNGTGGASAAVSANFAVTAVSVQIVNAATPYISAQPVSGSYKKGAAAAALSVTASVSDGGTLSYQWYRNTANSTSGGTAVGIGATYTPSTAEVGTLYYYVVVTSTNNSVNGNKTATATSSVIAVATGPVSVLTPDRVVPNTKPGEEAAVIAPVTVLAGEFTAGPNPVDKQSGVVNFFRYGKRVANAELRIYDATGNVVGKVKISDKALDNQARRQVGSWDLTDKSGRHVSEGTYLVKGVLKTSDGKKEKVSVIVGVR